jgi:hypothetical protein
MSATSAPFGLRPAFHPSGLDRAQALANGIASGYGSNILKGQAVKYVTGGTIQPVTGTEAFVGAFAGVEWTDTTGRRRVSNYWPANTAGTAIVAYFYADQNIVYEIQTDGTVAQSSIGDEANLSNLTAGSTTTGLSQCTLSTTLAGVGNTAQMRILDIAPYADNAWDDNFVIVRANISNYQIGPVAGVAI